MKPSNENRAHISYSATKIDCKRKISVMRSRLALLHCSRPKRNFSRDHHCSATSTTQPYSWLQDVKSGLHLGGTQARPRQSNQSVGWSSERFSSVAGSRATEQHLGSGRLSSLKQRKGIKNSVCHHLLLTWRDSHSKTRGAINNWQHASTDLAFLGLYDPGSKNKKTGMKHSWAR